MKEKQYERILQQLCAVLEGEHDMIANMANMSALLFAELPELNWACLLYTSHIRHLLVKVLGKGFWLHCEDQSDSQNCNTNACNDFSFHIKSPSCSSYFMPGFPESFIITEYFHKVEQVNKMKKTQKICLIITIIFLSLIHISKTYRLL